MPNIFQARRAATLFTIGLGVGLLACVSCTQADEFEASYFAPRPTFQIVSSPFQLTSLIPFETHQTGPTYGPSEPFGTEVSTVVKGGLQKKWASVKKKLPREHRALLRCRADATTCLPAAKRFLAILDKAQTREGWARIAEINRAINLSIRPVDDMTQYGVADLWATPLMTFASNAGDCEDYAIAKYFALHEMGFLDSDLRLVVVHDRAANEDHAVTAVRHERRWIILDSRTLAIRTDVNIAEFDPLFVVDSDGVKRMTASSSIPQLPEARSAAIGPQFSSGLQGAPLLL